MGDDGNKGSTVPSYPPPSPILAAPPAQPISFVLALLAAIAAFLGYCLAAAILALLSFVFGLVGWLQLRGLIRAEQQWVQGARKWYDEYVVRKGASTEAGTGTGTGTAGKPDEPKRY